MARTAIVIIGGAAPLEAVVPLLPADRYVIAADSGLDHALKLGLAVDVLVGDLDSVSCAALSEAERSGMRIVRHPHRKDVTDTELAIEIARSHGCARMIGVAGGGDRLDHVLGAIQAFASPELADRRVELWWNDQLVEVLHGPGVLELAPGAPAGSLVSLVPLLGNAEAVTTEGLEYPLHAETLSAASSRGVSNVRLGGPASVALRGGTLLVVSPLLPEGSA